MSNLFYILVNFVKKKSKIDFICKTYFPDLYVCTTKNYTQ